MHTPSLPWESTSSHKMSYLPKHSYHMSTLWDCVARYDMAGPCQSPFSHGMGRVICQTKSVLSQVRETVFRAMRWDCVPSCNKRHLSDKCIRRLTSILLTPWDCVPYHVYDSPLSTPSYEKRLCPCYVFYIPLSTPCYEKRLTYDIRWAICRTIHALN